MDTLAEARTVLTQSQTSLDQVKQNLTGVLQFLESVVDKPVVRVDTVDDSTQKLQSVLMVYNTTTEEELVRAYQHLILHLNEYCNQFTMKCYERLQQGDYKDNPLLDPPQYIPFPPKWTF